MKAKYLFYSLALASAFTACTQEELVEAPALEKNEVANRPVAGVVTFVNDEVDSRYNRQNATFENGDQMGLYLMDEFDYENGEPGNANNTYWDYQSAWWKMYNMVDYISTNYGYVYNSRTKEWVNHASRLVEGNYIALFPQNVLATNRRDLWYPIKSNVDLVAHTTTARKYVNRDNQFFVGYEQIKRDQEAGADGNLTAKISMKPILTYGVMEFDNNQADKIRLNKVVFTNANKSNLPNVAYVKPAGIEMTDAEAQAYMGKTWNAINPMYADLEAPYWAWSNREAMAEKIASTDCNGNVTIYAQGVYDRNTFTHAAARDMVEYGYASAGNAPYGMNPTGEYALSKEYTFNFPGAGVELAGNYEKESALTKCQISIALPAFDGWDDMKVVVYAEKWDGEKWVAGYISEKSGKEEGKTNAAWNLESLTLWEMGQELQTVTLAIDDEYFVALDEIEVGSASDFYNLVKGRLADHNTAIPVDLTVKPYSGTTLNVNADVVDLIDAYEAKYGSDKVNITFTDGNVKLNAENSIHKFNYSNVNVTLNADQTITEPIEIRDADRKFLVKKLVNNGQSTLTVLNEVNTMVENYGHMIVKKEVVNNKTMNGFVVELYNYFDLTLGKGANIEYMENQPGATTNVEAGTEGDIAYVNTLRNNGSVDRCDNCTKATLNVNAGELFVNSLHNYAVVNNESTLRVASMTNNELHTHNDGVHEAVVNNNGKIVGGSKYGVAATAFNIVNGATLNNSGTIEVKLYNNAIVNGLDGNVEKLQNNEDGIIYIKSADIHVKTLEASEGKIVFVGVINQFVGTEGNDTKIYQTTADIKDLEIDDMMTKTGVTVLWLSHNVTIEQNTVGDAKWSSVNRAKLEGIVVKQGKTVTLTSDKTGTNLNVPNAELTVETNAKLKIANAMNVTVKSYTGNIDLSSNTKLNGNTVHSGN